MEKVEKKISWKKHIYSRIFVWFKQLPAQITLHWTQQKQKKKKQRISVLWENTFYVNWPLPPSLSLSPVCQPSPIIVGDRRLSCHHRQLLWWHRLYSHPLLIGWNSVLWLGSNRFVSYWQSQSCLWTPETINNVYWPYLPYRPH